mgnify:CR=1 FL=1
MRPTMSIHDCCELMRANQISVSESTLMAMIQAGQFPGWSVPSVDTKTSAPLISRAGFVEWLKDFYKLKVVHGI